MIAELWRRPDFRRVRTDEIPDHRNRRDSNYCALGVSMSLTGSAVFNYAAYNTAVKANLRVEYLRRRRL